MQVTQPNPQQHSPRAIAIRNAARAADAHQANPDTYTLHTMQTAVQTALNLRATPDDIRAARTTAVNA